MSNILIYLITNRHLVSEGIYFNTLKEASKYKGLKIILREKDLSDEAYKQLYYKIKKIVKDTEIIINSKINVFNKINEETIQLPFKDFMKLNNCDFKVGVSVHSVQEGIEAYKKGADYLLASHIFETSCKVGLKPKGVELIKELKKNVKCKVIALGGINTGNYKEVIEAGADGIAIMSLLFLSNNIEREIMKFTL